MLQQFYHDTMISKFIKHLLSQENIPLCDVIQPGDIILKDAFYIYDTFVIQCLSSGVFQVSDKATLYPSDNVYPSSLIFPKTGKISGKYKVIRNYNMNDFIPNLTYKYKSNTSYYDAKTHYHLGQYLRYKSKLTGVNLMPFYNCFTGEYIDDVYITRNPDYSFGTQGSVDSVIPQFILAEGSNKAYKIASIPIKFNTSYTVAIDCQSEVYVGYRIYDADSGIVHDANGDDLSNALFTRYNLRYSSSFNKPFVVSCNYETVGAVTNLQNNLKLLIQVPYSNDSSIVVLEGDYTQSSSSVHNLLDDSLLDEDKGFKYWCEVNNLNFTQYLTQLEYNIKVDPKPLLLLFNTRSSYPFSPRLIEHLLLNVVSSTETLTDNIKNLQKLLCKVDPIYREHHYGMSLTDGVWNDYISYALNRQINSIGAVSYLRDQNGFYNVDLEKYLQNKRKVNLLNV